MRPWGLRRGLVAERPIVTRLVLTVSGTMAVVLLLAGGFVFWRVQFALSRQVDQDLDAYQELVEHALATGQTAPSDTPGQSYQVYDEQGSVVGGDAIGRLVDRATVAAAYAGHEQRSDVGRLLPPSRRAYRVVTVRQEAPGGRVVVAYAISRHKHDEALRELLLQLLIADLVTLAAASVVGYRTARAALNPVERYRVAAERAGADTHLRLPVAEHREDELSRLGHTLNGFLDRLRQSNERERQFLGDASHELRSPLALMRTELEWGLMHADDPAETAACLESMRRQVERLIVLSDSLLDLEEVRAGDDTVRAPVDVGKLLRDVAQRFAGDASARHRAIVTSSEPGLSVEGNYHWLELAVGNLVSNALRHGAGTVHVSGGATGAGDHPRVGIVVRDEGPGFPADFVDKAFDRFSRAEASRTTRGTGLGLALVQAVADAHHGTATISGSRVTIDLPGDVVPAVPEGTEPDLPTGERERAGGR
jgi:signal transduction histidine kinase